MDDHLALLGECRGSSVVEPLCDSQPSRDVRVMLVFREVCRRRDHSIFERPTLGGFTGGKNLYAVTGGSKLMEIAHRILVIGEIIILAHIVAKNRLRARHGGTYRSDLQHGDHDRESYAVGGESSHVHLRRFVLASAWIVHNPDRILHRTTG